MTWNEDRIEDLKFFGYSSREARFLYLTAIYSGYFIRRQYRRFTGLSGGSPDDLLVRKVLALKHGKRYSTCRRTYLYHLCARPFYNAIGQPHNRHRRRRPAFAIKTKLMALDYVLDNQNERYLATEEEKVGYFHEERGIPLYLLPSKSYPHPRTSTKTRRFFVEKFPIFIDGTQDSSRPMVSFCYIDEGIISTPGFETFLRQYSDLFVALGHFRVVWVGKKRGNMRSASRIFHRLFNSAEGMRERFKHPRYDHLFELWKQDGDAAIRQELGGNDAARHEFRARIQIYPMSHRYDFL